MSGFVLKKSYAKTFFPNLFLNFFFMDIQVLELVILGSVDRCLKRLYGLKVISVLTC